MLSPQTFDARRGYARSYTEIGAHGATTEASPHRLIALLYNGLCDEISAARGALARQETAAKCRSVSKAVRILEEGLDMALDVKAGGELAENLRALYRYMVERLTLANARNDDAMLNEVWKLADTLRDGWAGIAPQADATVEAA